MLCDILELHVFMYEFIYVLRMCVSVYMSVYVCVHACMNMYVCVYECMYTYIFCQ